MEPHHCTPLKTLSGLFMFMSFVFLFSCNNKSKLVEVNPEFSKYIDAYTSGVVSKKPRCAYSLRQMPGLHTL